MKTAIHPKYFEEAQVKCANCGAGFVCGATRAEINIEICSKCHPFYTGKKILIDTEGRVDKFNKKFDGASDKKKKVRKKNTLEERVNKEITDQLKKEKEKAEKPGKAAKAEEA